MKMFLKTLELENFKGCKHMLIDFSDITSICGKNATGKSTLYDAFTWVLFNKNSLSKKEFSIRTVDDAGEPIHNIEITVRLVLEVDGVDYELVKTQKENWVRRRGSTDSELQGNNNKYYINSVVKSESEYKKFISSLISETDFKLLTDYKYFIGLPAMPKLNTKEPSKREMLLRLCGDYTPEDLLNSDPEHWKLIHDDVLLGGIDGAMAKAKKQLSRLKKEQEEVPIRIDEASKQLTDVPDIMSLEEQKATLLAKIKAQEEMISVVKSEDESQKIKQEIAKAEQECDAIYDSIQRDFREKKQAAYDRMVNLRAAMNSARFDAENYLSYYKRYAKEYNDDIKALSDLKAKFDEIQLIPFNASSETCPICGRKFPQERVDELHRNFEETKRNDALKVQEKARKVKAHCEEAQKKAEEYNRLFLDTQDKYKQAEADFKDVEKEYNSLPERADVSDNQTIKTMQEHMDYLRSQLAKMAEKTDEIRKMEIDLIELKSMLADTERSITEANAVIASNDAVKQRIESLQKEQRDLGQRTADAEHVVILCEEFSRKQSEMLTQKINSNFELARFTMFEKQLNGGIKETCEIMHNGVKYDSLNTGHQITVALDIIKTFQKLYGIHAPIWIDNAECLSSDNQPNMDCQLILLKVTDDDILTVR